MNVSEMIEAGRAALKEGNRDQALALLNDAVTTEPDNAQAWYYLAMAQSEAADKRRSLEKALELSPGNPRIAEALEKVGGRATSTPPPRASASQSTASSGGGFKLPVDIPGAPERVDPQEVLQGFVARFRQGVDVLRRQPGAYAQEVQEATWWRFWSYVVVAYIITAVLNTITSFIYLSQLAASLSGLSQTLSEAVRVAQPSLLNVLGNLIISAPLSIATVYAGLFASHYWVANNRNGHGSLAGHAYAIALPIVTASLIVAVASLISAFIPFLGALVGFASLVFSIYALYIAVDGIVTVHKVDRNAGYITLAIFIIVQIVVGLILGLLMAPFILSTGGFRLF